MKFKTVKDVIKYLERMNDLKFGSEKEIMEMHDRIESFCYKIPHSPVFRDSLYIPEGFEWIEGMQCLRMFKLIDFDIQTYYQVAFGMLTNEDTGEMVRLHFLVVEEGKLPEKEARVKSNKEYYEVKAQIEALQEEHERTIDKYYQYSDDYRVWKRNSEKVEKYLNEVGRLENKIS